MKPILILAIWMGTLAGTATLAEAPDAGYHRPVAVELLSYLDVHYVHRGSSIFVKLKEPWEGLGCYLFDGQVLQGKVELATVHGSDQKESQLAISFFNVPCLGSKSTLNLVLGAVEWDSGVSKMPHAMYPVVNYTLGAGHAGLQGSFNGSGIEWMAMSQQPKNRIPLYPGDVLGIEDVTLKMGQGPERSSLLTSTKRNVHLEKESLLLLVPEAIAFPKGGASGGEPVLQRTAAAASAPEPGPVAEAPVPPRAPPLPPPMEFEPCEPPACAVDLPVSDHEMHGVASKSIGIHQLGYAPRPQREVVDLNDDVALAWLGPREIFVAFNPHTLVQRDGQVESGAAVRRIHAVVLDVATSKVVSSADWFLPDTGEFLWQLSGGRVLVHFGNELRIYGEEMKVEREILLDGPLKFVRISPNGELTAIAIVREIHTPEQHASLRASMTTEPPENVEIRVLDKEFKTVAQDTTSSEIMAPTLLNEGQVDLLAKPKMEYRLALRAWNGQASTVARFSSSCLPAASSFAPDLLFVRTCGKDDGTQEYRVLRANGQVVLHGRFDPQELGQEAAGNSLSMRFAVKVVHASSAVARGEVFHGTDLASEDVGVYRAGDGKRIATVHVDSPEPSHGGYALSPDGSELAVLAGSRITLYEVPADGVR